MTAPAEGTVSDPPLELASGADGRDSPGSIRVANEVVAWIAALAALDVDGVRAMYRPGGQQIDRILRRPVAHRGVRVRMAEDGSLTIDVWMAMDSGSSVPVVGAQVQQAIARAIERMLDLRLAAVNVFVSEVVFP
ncbi:MAG: Asp23/Gls24 family envelope stress response protein [Candidatus Dormibacteria bacterium]